MDSKAVKQSASKISPPLLWAHGVAGALFLLLQALPVFYPALCLRWFCEPAARVAAVFLGTPMLVQTDSIYLAHPTIDVAVTEACSGYDFFSLFIALLIGVAVFRQHSKWWLLRDAVLIFVAGYGLTLFANASRIVCAVQIRATTADLIPASFDAVIHQTIGVIVFVTLLALSWSLLTKLHERKRIT